MAKTKNLVIVYTGLGQGKTSAALGLTLRALREGRQVTMIQFIKSQHQSGEMKLQKILPKLKIKCFGQGFVFKQQETVQNKWCKNLVFEKHRLTAQNGLEYTKELINSERAQFIILDEIFVAYNLKLITLVDLINLIKVFRQSIHTALVLTGRGCPKAIYNLADQVTELKNIKHPFQKGIIAQKGIDF